MDPGILEDIGFTNAEIKVYIALLELGQVTAGPIIERSGLQSSVVHATLNKLLSKGLLSCVKEGRRNHYCASNPKHIVEYINEKRERYEKALPELLLKQQMAHKAPIITSFKGIRGIKELLYELLDAQGKEHHTFGSAKRSLMMGEGWWLAYHRKRAQRNIHAKLLFNESLSQWMAARGYPAAQVRYTKKGFEPLTETIIRGDKIGIVLWIDEPIGTLIHSSEAAKSYDAFFTMLWGSAKNSPDAQH